MAASSPAGARAESENIIYPSVCGVGVVPKVSETERAAVEAAAVKVKATPKADGEAVVKSSIVARVVTQCVS